MREHDTGLHLTLWLVTGLVAALFFVAGGAKIGGWLDQQFVDWGYSPGFAVLIGIFEVLFAIALLFERSATWAAFGLMAILLGAIGTHLSAGEWSMILVPIAVFVMLGFIAWGRGPERSGLRARQPVTPRP
ncbi:MAG TPA: DoxX family protein [Enhygromyxa sp.]|nr:DoxX family protein [Enhygromyxa sp.]